MALWSTIAAARCSESYLLISVSGANDLTLTTDQAAAKELELNGALTGNINLIIPATATEVGFEWTIFNNTSGSFTLTVKAATGSGVAVTQLKRARVLWNGTSFVSLQSDIVALGAAASGANSDITSLSAISSGITAYGGMNLGDALKGNSAQSKPFQLGRLSKSVAGAANVTLAANEYVNPILEFTGLLTGSISVFVPLTSGAPFIVFNNTTGSFTLTVIGATGTGVVVAQTKTAVLYADGTNIRRVTADNP